MGGIKAFFFIFLVENEAKNKNEQTKAYSQAILPAFVHPCAQDNQAVLMMEFLEFNLKYQLFISGVSS